VRGEYSPPGSRDSAAPARASAREGRPRWLALAVALSIAALASAATLNPLTTNDLWVHLSVGRETARDILAGQGVPNEERFSFTAQGRPLVPHEWLSGLILYLCYSAGGPLGVQALRLALVLGALAGLARAARLAGAGSGATAWMLVFLLLAVAPRLVERPHLFTYGLAGWTLATLGLDAQRASQGGSRMAWLLVPVMVLWGNLHGGFVVGFFVIGCFLLAAVAALLPLPPALRSLLSLARPATGAGGTTPPHRRPTRAEGEAPPSSTRARRLALVLCASLASLAILNPAGPRLFLFPFEITSMPVVSSSIYEWRSPLVTSYRTTLPFALTLLWGILLLAGLRAARARPGRPSEGGWGLSGSIIALAFAALALRQMRSLADFVVLTAPWMAVALESLQASLRHRRWRLPEGPLPAAIAAVVAAALIVVFGYPARANVRIRCIPPLVSPKTPVAAAEFIASVPGLPAEARLFNSYPLGGYLAWRLQGRARILIDSRNEAYGDELTRRILLAFREVPVFEQEVARWKPDLLVLDWRARSDSAVLKRLVDGGGWKPVFLDDFVVVYAPDSSPLRPLRFCSPGQFDIQRIGPREAAAALEEGGRLSSWQPGGVMASLLTGRALMVLGRQTEARRTLELAAASRPASPALWSLLAASRQATGDRAAAAQAMRVAEDLARSAPAEE